MIHGSPVFIGCSSVRFYIEAICRPARPLKSKVRLGETCVATCLVWVWDICCAEPQEEFLCRLQICCLLLPAFNPWLLLTLYNCFCSDTSSAFILRCRSRNAAMATCAFASLFVTDWQTESNWQSKSYSNLATPYDLGTSMCCSPSHNFSAFEP